MQIDILPFGGIEIDDEIRFSGTGFTSIKVNGFSEVYQAGTQEIQLTTGHSFKVATLPAIVLLKLIAYNDRPEIRLRDAPDVINILRHFFDLQADLIYDHHADLFGGEQMELVEIAAIVTGREMRTIVADNQALNTRIAGIIKGLIDAKENSAFIRMMVTESGRSVENILNLMKRLLTGFKQIDTE